MTDGTASDKPDDLDELASLYVLGTLSAAERVDVQARLANEPALRAAVDAWEQRLLELTELAPPQPPSTLLWRRIERSLKAHGHPQPAAEIARAGGWWNRLPLWRGLAGAGLAATLVLGAMLVLRPATMPSADYLVVLVAPQSQAPGWVIQASETNALQLVPLGVVNVPADKTLQFWTKADDWQGPVSLGLIEPGRTRSISLEDLPPLEPNQLFELTLEGPNGSPTGKPTGPIQFIGRAVKVI